MIVPMFHKSQIFGRVCSEGVENIALNGRRYNVSHRSVSVLRRLNLLVFLARAPATSPCLKSTQQAVP